MEEYDVQIGVLTVPIEIAQCITDMMVDGGIKQSGTLPRSVSVYLRTSWYRIHPFTLIWRDVQPLNFNEIK